MDDMITQQDQILQTLKKNLATTQNRMKQQANQKKSECTFEMGDMGFLRLQPYTQISLKLKAKQKLALRFYRPYKILQQVEAISYKLEQPTFEKFTQLFTYFASKKYMDRICRYKLFFQNLQRKAWSS